MMVVIMSHESFLSPREFKDHQVLEEFKGTRQVLKIDVAFLLQR